MPTSLVIKNRVKETTSTVGTGTYLLLGAALGFRSFAGIGAGNTTWYEASDGLNWEIGLGTYVFSPPQLQRTAIYDSSNGGAPVSWGVGTRTIWVVNPAERLAFGRQAIWLPAGSWTPRVTSGCAALATIEKATNKNLINYLAFDSASQEFAQTDVRMPPSWDLGTLSAVPIWSHAATATNFGIVFGFDAVAVRDDDTQDVAFGTAQTSTDTGGTTDDEYIAPETAAITPGGTAALGCKVMIRVHRDPSNGSDTMAIDARFEGAMVFFTTDRYVEA